MTDFLKVSSSPHFYTTESVPSIMKGVVISLAPATLGAVYFFGWHAALLIVLCVGAAVGTEALCQRLRGVPPAIGDYSAIVTGLLLAFNLPANAPWWIAILGGVFAIAVVKEVFGGIGFNIWNPALAARAFLLASFPTAMISSPNYPAPRGGTLSGLTLDGVTQATPLQLLKNTVAPILQNPSAYGAQEVQRAHDILAQTGQVEFYKNLLIGNMGGVLGETSALLLLMGAIYLFVKKYIDWRVPLGYIGSVALTAWIFAGHEGYFTGDALLHVLSGGLILGAFFMATDMVTSPVTRKGKWIFAVGCGLLTVLIRVKGGYPEGVSYAILLMNTATPLIDAWTRPRVYGAATTGGK
jgi:Na+-translocating ferredoxin:NAD+ oxidoreductase subunit D